MRLSKYGVNETPCKAIATGEKIEENEFEEGKKRRTCHKLAVESSIHRRIACNGLGSEGGDARTVVAVTSSRRLVLLTPSLGYLHVLSRASDAGGNSSETPPRHFHRFSLYLRSRPTFIINDARAAS
jgi:hypothetical protein